MTCSEVQEELSAGLDGARPTGALSLDEHLAACRDCVRWFAAAAAITRRARLATAPRTPPETSFTAQVLGAVLPDLLAGVERRARRQRSARNGLAAAGGALLLLVLCSLVGFTRYVPEAAHLTSATAFWAALLGAGFVAVAWSPERSTTAAPFLATSAAFLVVATAFDLVDRHLHLLHEVPTVFAIGGMLAVVVLAWPRRDGLAG